MKRHRASWGLATGLLWIALAANAPGQTTIVPKELPNLGVLQTELQEYHDCKGTHGCYEKDLDRETAEATAALDRMVRANRGRENQSRVKLAVVLDIDETSLSNWAEITRADFAYNADTWNRWVEEAKAPA